jgi:hypothetical protein
MNNPPARALKRDQASLSCVTGRESNAMSRWIDRADLDVRCLPSALGDIDGRRAAPGTRPNLAAALGAQLRDWRDSFAVSGLAYLLREKAWSSSSWELAPVRVAGPRKGFRTSRRALHLS